MNGAYGEGPAAFDALFERIADILTKGFWIAACALGVLVVLWIARKWSEA